MSAYRVSSHDPLYGSHRTGPRPRSRSYQGHGSATTSGRVRSYTLGTGAPVPARRSVTRVVGVAVIAGSWNRCRPAGGGRRMAGVRRRAAGGNGHGDARLGALIGLAHGGDGAHRCPAVGSAPVTSSVARDVVPGEPVSSGRIRSRFRYTVRVLSGLPASTAASRSPAVVSGRVPVRAAVRSAIS